MGPVLVEILDFLLDLLIFPNRYWVVVTVILTLVMLAGILAYYDIKLFLTMLFIACCGIGIYFTWVLVRELSGL